MNPSDYRYRPQTNTLLMNSCMKEYYKTSLHHPKQLLSSFPLHPPNLIKYLRVLSKMPPKLRNKTKI